jgi:hypothetical protein
MVTNSLLFSLVPSPCLFLGWPGGLAQAFCGLYLPLPGALLHDMCFPSLPASIHPAPPLASYPAGCFLFIFPRLELQEGRDEGADDRAMSLHP